MSMKICFVGTGALGGYYAACLARSGEQVHCLCRSDYDAVAGSGLRVKSCFGDFTAKVAAHRSTDSMGIADLVIVAVKTTSNQAVPELLKPIVGEETLILTLQNGLGNEDMLAKHFPREHIMGGVCFLCANRIGPGYIDHIAHGHISIAEFSGGILERTRRIAEMFSRAGVRCQAVESLGEIRWKKSVWNIPFNALSVVANHATVQDILDDPELLSTCRRLMTETLSVARAEGYTIEDAFIDQNIEYSKPMGHYRTSMQLDHEHGRPLEFESVVGEPLRRGRLRGLDLPDLQMLYAMLARWGSAGAKPGRNRQVV